jgi:arylformamidase
MKGFPKVPLYDATVLIREGMLTFPGDPPFKIDSFFSRAKGDPFDLALMSIGTHLGTHVDPPAHYLDGGATVDQIPLDIMVGPGIVMDMRGRSQIDRCALEKSNLQDHPRVLFKTDNTRLLWAKEFQQDYTYLTEDGAMFLVEKKVQLVGTDYFSIEKYRNPGAPVHKTLLEAGVLIVETLNLSEIPVGPCEIYCLPLKIQGADGAPARVIIKTH